MIAIKAFVSRVRTEHFSPLLHQPVLCPTMEEHLSVISDLPQSPRFCYSNQIFHLLSDALLLDDQLPSCHRGDLSTAAAEETVECLALMNIFCSSYTFYAA